MECALAPLGLAAVHDREEAEAELAAVLEDEPAWLPDLWVEPFELVVSE